MLPISNICFEITGERQTWFGGFLRRIAGAPILTIWSTVSSEVLQFLLQRAQCRTLQAHWIGAAEDGTIHARQSHGCSDSSLRNHTLNQINSLSNLHTVHARKLGLTTQVQPSIGDDPIMFPISQLHHPHNHYHIPQNPRNSTNIATTIWLLTNKLILTLHHPATNQDHQKNIESKFTSQGPHSKQREKRNALNREPSNLAKTRIQWIFGGCIWLETFSLHSRPRTGSRLTPVNKLTQAKKKKKKIHVCSFCSQCEQSRVVELWDEVGGGKMVGSCEGGDGEAVGDSRRMLFILFTNTTWLLEGAWDSGI